MSKTVIKRAGLRRFDCEGCRGGRCPGCLYDPDPAVVERREWMWLGRLSGWSGETIDVCAR